MPTFTVQWAPELLRLAREQWQAYMKGAPPPAPDSLVVMATIDSLRFVLGEQEEDPDEDLDPDGEP